MGSWGRAICAAHPPSLVSMTRLSVSPAIHFRRTSQLTHHTRCWLPPLHPSIPSNSWEHTTVVRSHPLRPALLLTKCRPPRVMSDRRTKGARGGCKREEGGAGSPTCSGAAGRGTAEISSNFCASSGESRDLLVLACLAPTKYVIGFARRTEWNSGVWIDHRRRFGTRRAAYGHGVCTCLIP